MRPILVLALAVAVFGGMQSLMTYHASDRAGQMPPPPTNSGTGVFRVEILLTFEAGPDEFSLDGSGTAASVAVWLAGEEIYRATGNIGCAEPIVVQPVPNVVVGSNQFYFEASPRDRAPSYHAVGVRVFRDEILIAEKVLLADPGGNVQGTLEVEVRE